MPKQIKPKNKSTKLAAGIIIVALILAVVLGFAIKGMSENQKSRKALSALAIANQYLLALDYEQAIIEFNKVLEIDKLNADAYLGIADSYVGLATRSIEEKDFDAAMEYYRDAKAKLKEAMDIIDDERLNAKSEEIDILADELENEKEKSDEGTENAEDTETEEVLEELDGPLYESPISLKELLYAPTIAGKSAMEYSGYEEVLAALPTIPPYEGEDNLYILKNEYANEEVDSLEYFFDEGNDAHMISVDYFTFATNTDNTFTAIQYMEYVNPAWEIYRTVIARGYIGKESKGEAGGMNEYVRGNGYNSTADIANALGIKDIPYDTPVYLKTDMGIAKVTKESTGELNYVGEEVDTYLFIIGNEYRVSLFDNREDDETINFIELIIEWLQ